MFTTILLIYHLAKKTLILYKVIVFCSRFPKTLKEVTLLRRKLNQLETTLIVNISLMNIDIILENKFKNKKRRKKKEEEKYIWIRNNLRKIFFMKEKKAIFVANVGESLITILSITNVRVMNGIRYEFCIRSSAYHLS